MLLLLSGQLCNPMLGLNTVELMYKLHLPMTVDWKNNLKNLYNPSTLMHTNTKPEYHEHEEFQNRSKKLKEIRELGIDPYPASYSPNHTPAGLQKEFDQ